MAVEIRAVDALRAEIKSTDSKITLLAEKIKRLEAQNVTIANSLFKITERLKKMEENAGPTAGRVDVEQSSDITTLKEELEKTLKESEAVKSEVYNMKYTLGLINPLEFVTVRQVNELVDERVEQKIAEMKRKAAKKERDDE